MYDASSGHHTSDMVMRACYAGKKYLGDMWQVVTMPGTRGVSELQCYGCYSGDKLITGSGNCAREVGTTSKNVLSTESKKIE